jgi:hypothetical protein
MTGEVSRARLLSLLSEACELEHALGCSYLFAAFSIRRELSEGIEWREQQQLRLWASRIYHVAAEEMLHFAQAWNLLTAVGGSPYYSRPNFPQPAKCYPLNVAILLRPFDLATMDRFVYYESPAHEDPTLSPAFVPVHALWPIDETFEYKSVGHLYGECLRIIENLDERELFVGSFDRQIGRELIDFPNIVCVNDRRSAKRAIQNITEQGEGTIGDREDSHFKVFCSIRDELRYWRGRNKPARPVGDNPYVRRRRDQIASALIPDFSQSAIETTEVTDPLAILAIDLFDDIYVSMLQALAYVFSNCTQDEANLKVFAESAIQIMITIIKPLGEAICCLPSGREGINAGPTFAMSRHAQLPAPFQVARLVYGDRLVQLAEHSQSLSRELQKAYPAAASQVESASGNLARIAACVRPST